MKRAAVIVGLVVFLVLAGTGVGYAVWTASSTISTTVTIGDLDASPLSCSVNEDNTNVILAWSNPPEASTTVRYQAFYSDPNGGAETLIGQSVGYWSTELWLSAEDFKATGRYIVRVRMYTDAAFAARGLVVGEHPVEIFQNTWRSGLRGDCL